MRGCGLLLLLWIVPASGAAQTPVGAIAGRVLDARTGEPVAHALVSLELATPGLILDAPGSVARHRSQLTGESGAYRFGDVVPGTYRLRIERLGYRASAVTVEVRRPAAADLSVAIEQEAVLLEPVRVEQRAHALFATPSAGPALEDAARISAERLRQELFVAPDSRVLTWTDVTEGVTLAEGDVFRALQRFPGVGTRDDYSAELWTRGAPWPHTRVTFDGVPLFNPLHAVGVLSAIAPDVLGAVFFHPGVRPPGMPGGAAAVVDLRTRPGAGEGELRGSAELSLASAGVALEQRIPGRAAWLVVARRSHLNTLQGGLGSLGLDTVDLPFRFHDVAARVDVQLAGRTRVELSGLWEEDHLDGDVVGVLERTQARWGNRAGRFTLTTELGGVEFSQGIGASGFLVETDARVVRTRDPARGWTEPAGSNRIRHTLLSGAAGPATRGGVPRWSVGYDVAWKHVDYDGPMPRVHAVRPDTMRRVRYDRSLHVLGMHGDVRFRTRAGRLTINPGVRVEAVEGRDNRMLPEERAEPVRFRTAPRIALRYGATGVQTVAFAAGRSWQHVQAIGLAGPSVHPAFHASHFWLWSGAGAPALRADVASIGTERWLGDGWLAGITLFARRTTGMAVPDPAPGRLAGRAPWVEGVNHARGVELTARRIGARWSASTSYTLGRSELEAEGMRYPALADRRHIVDATAAVRLPVNLRAAAAFSAMSAAPFTRAYSRLQSDCSDFGFGCDSPAGSWVESPNAERTPSYQSLDVALHWTQPLGSRGTRARAEVGAYVQVRNVLGRDNASTYAGSAPIGRSETREGVDVLWDDRFERGLPRLPLAGLRLRLR